MTSADLYNQAGPAYQRAWIRLQMHCEYPASLEVFNEELHDMQKRRVGVTIDACAESISRSYKRLDA